MATIREMQETAREALDRASSVKQYLENIFENRGEIAAIVMNDGNMKANVFEIYELLDDTMQMIEILTAYCISEKQIEPHK